MKEIITLVIKNYNGDQLTNDTNGKITSIVLAQYKQIRESLARMTPLEKRTIECYAKLEEELTNLTIGLLLRDEFEREVTYPNSEMYSDPDYHFASKDNYVDWKEFKECITDIYECRLEDDSFDMHGVYSPWDKNPYKSELGLDGMTK